MTISVMPHFVQHHRRQAIVVFDKVTSSSLSTSAPSGNIKAFGAPGAAINFSDSGVRSGVSQAASPPEQLLQRLLPLDRECGRARSRSGPKRLCMLAQRLFH